MNTLKVLLTEDMVIKICAKGMAVALGQAKVLVHMQSVDLAPIDELAGKQIGQHFILRGSGREDHIDLALLCDDTCDDLFGILGSTCAHLGTGGILLNDKLIFCKLTNHGIYLLIIIFLLSILLNFATNNSVILS